MTDQNELPDRFPRPAPETDEQRWRRIIASVHWPVTPEFATDQEWTDLVREGRKRRQRQRDFEESLRLDSNLPPPDPDLIVKAVQSGRGLWRSMTVVAEEKAAQAAAEEAARRDETLAIAPEPEF